MPQRQGHASTAAAGAPVDATSASPDEHAMASRRQPDILVLGLGNTLLTDDAVGVLVVDGLQRAGDVAEGVSLIDGGTLSFSLLGAITDCDGLVVVDAVRMGMPPGTVRRFEDEAMDRLLVRGKLCSVHELSLAELLDMARLQDRLPRRRALVAIEPESVDWGTEPTDAVVGALPNAMAEVRTLTSVWSSG